MITPTKFEDKNVGTGLRTVRAENAPDRRGQWIMVCLPPASIQIYNSLRGAPRSLQMLFQKTKGEIIMDFYQVPIGFGLALSSNTAAMNRYAHLSESQKQDILNKAHNVRSEEEMYSLVASLANGTIE